jgi:predicted HTH transcriptional regulator
MNIKRLILEGENVSLDFKKTISNAEKIAKTLVAFANNRGGKLLIGVTDDGAIKGVKSEEEEQFMINKAANLFCKPPIVPIFEEVYVDEKLILIVEIKKSEHKPHYALDEHKKWWAYYRVKDKSVLASKIVIAILKLSNTTHGQLISYAKEHEILLSYLKQHLRITLNEYCKLTRMSHKKAQKIIVSFVVSGILIHHFSEKEEFFTAAS